MWHVNVSASVNWANLELNFFKCCNPEINGGGGWGIFNALFGWTNSATYGSVISYNLYWLVVIATFLAMRYNEKNGHWPLMRAKTPKADEAETSSDEEASVKDRQQKKEEGFTSEVRSVES